MKVLVAHTVYRQRGGEEAVADREVGLLRAEGCTVSTLFPKSAEFDGLSLSTRWRMGLNTGDHRYGRVLVRQALDGQGVPDVAHFHNLFPMLGYGAIDEADRCGCATVTTLHNYRLSCLKGTHRLGDSRCERCRPGHYGPGIARACYRGSHVQSAALARGLTRYWDGLRSPSNRTVVLCLTGFMRERFTSFGLPAERVRVKSNSVAAPASVSEADERSGALFVGRLAPEKGALELVRHWPADGPLLTLAGSGPELELIHREAGSNVRVLGSVSSETVQELLATARVLMLPSLWFEGLPLVVLEAMAAGVPCAAFDVGSIHSFVGDDLSGILVEPGRFGSLVATSVAVCFEPTGDWRARSEAARARYEANYTDPQNTRGLIEAYEAAIQLRRGQ